MTASTTGSADTRLIPLPALFALLSVAAVCVSRAVLADGDTYTHIAAGTWMLVHRAVVRADPFTETFAGHAWTAHEWLSEVLLALAARAAGLTGVVLLTAAAIAVTFGNLARHVGGRCGWATTLILVGMAFACVAPSLLARPHVLALPVLEMWVAGLVAARDGGRGPPLALLPLMSVWANLHGGFAFGLAIAAVFAAEASVAEGWRGARRWWWFVAAAVGAALVSPLGVEGLLFPLRLLHMKSLAAIEEWQPATMRTDLSLFAAVAGLLVLALLRPLRIGAVRIGLLALLLHLSLAHQRHAVLFAIVGALVLAEPIGRAVGSRPVIGGRSGARGWALCWSGLALIVVLRVAHPVAFADGRATPVSALAHAGPMAGRVPVLNTNSFGGYLTLAGVRPFIDGRAELFGDAFIDSYLAMAEPDGVKLREAVARYGFGWALLAVDDPLVEPFDRLTGWRERYRDGVAVVFERE